MSTLTDTPCLPPDTESVPVLVKHGSHLYEFGDLALEHGINDSLLAYAYERFRREGLLPVLFYEGVPSMLWFLQEYLKPETHTLGCYQRDADGQWHLQGMMWNNCFVKMGPDHLRCNIGIGFFRHVSHSVPVRFAHLAVEWAFDNTDVDVIHATTPVKNRAISLFAKKAGFTTCGPLPGGTVWEGELCPVMFSAMTRSAWESQRPWGEIRTG